MGFNLRRIFLTTLVFSLVSAAPFTDLAMPYPKSLSSQQQLAILQQLEALLSRDQNGNQSPERKRGGLGNCIHNCMHSGGGLNFIQCKTMCYWKPDDKCQSTSQLPYWSNMFW